MRVLIHFTGRPVSFEASSTSGVSLKIGVFIPKLPPVSPVMMRILLSGTLSTFASSVRVGCGRCMGVVDRVAAISGVVVANGAARLHRGSGHAINNETMPHNMASARETAVSTAALSPINSTKQILSGQSSHTRRACLGASAVEVTAGNSS